MTPELSFEPRHGLKWGDRVKLHFESPDDTFAYLMEHDCATTRAPGEVMGFWQGYVIVDFWMEDYPGQWCCLITPPTYLQRQ